MVGIELWGLSRLMVVHGLGETSHPPGLLHDRVHMGSCWPFPAVLPAQTHSALFHFIAFVRTCDYSFHFHLHGLHFHEEILLLPCPLLYLQPYVQSWINICQIVFTKKKMLLSYLTRPLRLFFSLHVSIKSQVIGFERRPIESSGLYWESEAFYSSTPQNKQKNTTKNNEKFLFDILVS